MNRRRTLPYLFLASLALVACSGDPATDGRAVEAPNIAEAPDLSVLAGREIFEPQLVVEADGTLLLIWREKVEAGFDLFSAHRTDDGAFSEPFRINDEPGSVYAYPHDEMRPAIATSPDGMLAVVWTDERAQIRAAVGREHGTAWEPSIRLDQAEAPAYRSFTATTIDSDGALHAVWIDSRFAPQAGAEEPADLFYARLLDGEVTEINLTADQEASICGCCKPDLELAADGALRAIFRNTTADGYRDIFTISGSIEAGFAPPERVGPPTWKLRGCPMSGPVGLGDQVLWRDAESGQWVVKRGHPGTDHTTPIFAAGEDGWTSIASPREVAGSAVTVLVPGTPYSRLIERRGDEWVIHRGDLPASATSAATLGDGLLVAGAVEGKLELELLAGS